MAYETVWKYWMIRQRIVIYTLTVLIRGAELWLEIWMVE